MSQNEIKTVTRVYKYGVVFDLPIARNFPEDAVSELFKANKLWNRLVETHRDHQKIFEKARRKASKDYRKKAEKIDTLNKEIDTCYKVDLRKAHLAASDRNKNHPINKLVHDKIKELKAERTELYKAIKEPRKIATAEVDTSALDDAFWRDVKSACLIENSQIDSSIANEIQRYFKTARSKAFSDRATLRFHPFDGTGFWHWRFRLSNNYAGKKATADGVKWPELFGKLEDNKVTSPLDKKRFVLLKERFIGKGKKRAIRAAATLAGKGDNALRLEFDIILHRPIPPNAQIQNAKLIRTRTGDQFKYHICFTVRLPEETLHLRPYSLALGIDPGFREEEKRLTTSNTRDFRPLKITQCAFSEQGREAAKISLDEDIVKKATLREVNKSDFDKSAAELGKRILPLLKGVILPQDIERREGREKQLEAIIKAEKKSGTVSFEHAYKLAKWVIYDTQTGSRIFSEPLRSLVTNWFENNKHEYMGVHGMRRRLVQWRNEIYRIEAFNIVKMAKEKGFIIAVENTQYKSMIDIKTGETDLSPQARANRFLAAPATFISAVKNAADREAVPFVKVPPANTSKRCSASACQKINKNLGSEEVWVCPFCGTKHDRDQNAATNIARAGLKIWNNQVERKTSESKNLY